MKQTLISHDLDFQKSRCRLKGRILKPAQRSLPKVFWHALHIKRIKWQKFGRQFDISPLFLIDILKTNILKFAQKATKTWLNLLLLLWCFDEKNGDILSNCSKVSFFVQYTRRINHDPKIYHPYFHWYFYQNDHFVCIKQA